MKITCEGIDLDLVSRPVETLRRPQSKDPYEKYTLF